MQITIELPDDIANRLSQQVNNLSQQALEALAIEGDRSDRLGHSEVGRMLNLNGQEVEAFLIDEIEFS